MGFHTLSASFRSEDTTMKTLHKTAVFLLPLLVSGHPSDVLVNMCVSWMYNLFLIGVMSFPIVSLVGLVCSGTINLFLTSMLNRIETEESWEYLRDSNAMSLDNARLVLICLNLGFYHGFNICFSSHLGVLGQFWSCRQCRVLSQVLWQKWWLQVVVMGAR